MVIRNPIPNQTQEPAMSAPLTSDEYLKRAREMRWLAQKARAEGRIHDAVLYDHCADFDEIAARLA
jgi:hypothetical protein